MENVGLYVITSVDAEFCDQVEIGAKFAKEVK